MKIKVIKNPIKVLSFDTESRPLSWIGADWMSVELTAIAAAFTSEKKVHCWMLGECTSEEMLSGFVKLYNEATIVTGHYIRNHDLPRINAALLEFGLPPLSPKLTQDTMKDLVKIQGISKSQESLSDIYRSENKKLGMSQKMWRSANRLEPKGIAYAKERVISDILQQIETRQNLLDQGMLSPPKMWKGR